MVRGYGRQYHANKYAKNMSNNNLEPSVGKRIGEFLILSIYLMIDVYEVWPKSHFSPF
jgi:hypothetical protein